MKDSVIAILASGEGTTAEAFIRANLAGKTSVRTGLVIASKPDAGIIARVDRLNQEFGLNIQCLVIGPATHPATPDEQLGPGDQSKSEEAAILAALQAGHFDAIVLMGYMRKIGKTLVHAFGWRPEYTSPYQARLLNTHAGLFPETKGLYGRHKQERVIADKLTRSGTTLHVVAEDYDDGPTIAEHVTQVAPNETVDSLLEKDQAAEKQYLPTDVEAFIAASRKYNQKETSE